MPRRALWRVHPNDPTTALGWLLAASAGRSLSPVMAMVLAFGLLFFTSAYGSWLLTAFPLLLLNVRLPCRPPDLAPLRTTPPPGPAFACRLQSHLEASALGTGTLVGEDEGVVTFVEGWLHYAGRRTEFAVRRADLADAAGGTLWLGDENTGVLRPLNVEEDDAFRRAFRVWAVNKESPEGESILPPRSVHPSGLARAWYGALVSAASLFAFLGIVIAFNFGFLAFAIVGTGGATAFRRLVQLRQLAREEQRARLEGRTA